MIEERPKHCAVHGEDEVPSAEAYIQAYGVHPLRRLSGWVMYPLVLALVAVITWDLLAMRGMLPVGGYPFAYITLIALAAYLLGEGPAVVALVAGWVAFRYYFIDPTGTLWPAANSSQGWASQLIYLVSSITVGVVTVLLRRSRDFTSELLLRLQHELAERMVMEEELQISEEQTESILESITDGFFAFDCEWRFVYVNAAAESLFGRPRGELVGRSIWDEFAGLLGTEFEKQYRDAMEEGVTAAFEAAYPPLRKVFDVHVYPAEDGLTVYLRDITERAVAERREKELEEHKLEFYRRTIVAATNGKLVVTERSEIERIAGPAIASWTIGDADDLPDLRREIIAVARSQGMDDIRTTRLALCAGESITNTLKYANGGTVSLHRSRESLLLVVADRGPGIPALTLPDVALRDRFSTSGTLGMGYKVMIASGDRVYLATGPDGTTIAVEMRLHEAKSTPLASELLKEVAA